MNVRLRHFLAGMGSVLAVYPAMDVSRLVPRGTTEDRLRGVWQQVGEDISGAIEKADREQSPRAKSSS